MELSNLFYNPDNDNRTIVDIEVSNFRELVKKNNDGIYRNIIENKTKEVALGSDFFPIYSAIKLPSRNPDKLSTFLSDYYLFRMEKYWESESIITRACNKIMELLMKRGFSFESLEQKSLDLFNKEFNKILRNSPLKMSPSTLFRNICHQISVYGNTFLKKEYEEEVIRVIRITDPLAIKSVYDNNSGDQIGWTLQNGFRKRGDIEKHLKINSIQSPTLAKLYNKVLYRPNVFNLKTKSEDYLTLDEINHITYINLIQSSITMPLMYTVIEDVIALRSIESDIILHSYQYGHPLMHASIDRENLDPMELRSEAAILSNKISSMEGNGLIVTSDRVDIHLKGPEGTPPDLVKYQQMFMDRIEKGTGVPNIFSGNGGGTGRQSAETIEASVYAFINTIGNAIADNLQLLVDEIWNRNVLKKNKDFYEESPIKIRFADADANSERTHEQHILTLYQGGALSHGELRTSLKKPINLETKDKYFTDIQTENNNKEAAVAAKVKSQLTASNQHGKNYSKGSRKDNEEE